MELVRTTFDERIAEITSYIELVSKIEESASVGGPVLKTNTFEYKITPLQQRIMYAGIYLHLYNLVESTVSQLINAVERHAEKNIGENINNLSENMRRLWIKGITASKDDVTPEERLKKAIMLCDSVRGSLPFKMKIPKGGGGSWEHENILKISDNIGVNVVISADIFKLIKRPIKDGQGPLWLVKDVRNKLAHGEISFAQCGDNHTAEYFLNISEIIIKYLIDVIASYEAYIKSHGYLCVDVYQ